MNPDIFRMYDIRGIAARDLSDEVVTHIGQAYATTLKRQAELPHRVGVGRDARASSPRLFEALARGLEAAGVQVVDLGLIPTPLAYFAIFEPEGAPLGGAIQITGSHNPSDYNGFKMMLGRSTLHSQGITALRQLILDGNLDDGLSAAPREARPDLIAQYQRWIADQARPTARKLKVVLDAGNGVANLVAPKLVREVFGAEVIELFSEPDADFPNHHPDPTVAENLVHLIDAVRAHGADLGVAYDGDGDRIGVVDELGQIIWGDRLLIVLSRALLAEHPGATVIGEVKCSQTLFDDIIAHGGVPIMSAVGHSLIKAKIKETGALLAGEMSGHIFFNDRFFGFDDATYATCRLLEIVSATDQSLSALMADVPETFATPELRVACDEIAKFAIPGLVAKAFASQGLPVETIDGARVNFGQGWGLVRASNTQPVLVLRVEAASAELRDLYLAKLETAIIAAQRA